MKLAAIVIFFLFCLLIVNINRLLMICIFYAESFQVWGSRVAG